MPLTFLSACGCDDSIEVDTDEPSVSTIPLRRYWNGTIRHYLTIAQPITDLEESAQEYVFQAIEGHILPVQQPGTIPLKLFWNIIRKDYLTITTNDVSVLHNSIARTQTGYAIVRVEGFVFPNQYPGTVPLRLFWRAEWQDFFTTTGNPGFGYVHTGIVGYVFPCRQEAS